MAELSAKKAKKEKKRLAMLEQTDLNGSYNSETNQTKKNKKKLDKSVSEKENSVNGDSKEKNGQILDGSTKEDEPTTDISDEARKTKSTVRLSKQRMLEDCSYVESLLSLVRIQQHNLDEDEDPEDDDVDDVPEDIKQKMRKENELGRAATHEELRERLRRKMEELRGRNLSTNEERRKRKLKSKLSKVEKKAAEKDVLKQKLIKVGKGAGNLNKVKAEVDTLGATMVDRPKVKTETGKVVFSKFDFVSDEVVPDSIGKKKTLDPKAALAKIAASKEKLKDMAEAGKTDKVKRINDKMAWQAAIDKAEGVKVKDDVELLKKAVKRKEMKKKSSKQKWEQREEDLEKKKNTSQTKRKDNLQKRKKDVKSNIKKKLIKKGRIVPGV